MKSAAFLILALIVTGCERQEPGSPTPQTPSVAAPDATAKAVIDDPAADAEVLGYQIDRATGEQINAQVCNTCHATGIGGAPFTGDVQAWAPRIGKGMEELIGNSIDGYQGRTGFMPPRGGESTLTDDQVASAVVFMVEQSQKE